MSTSQPIAPRVRKTWRRYILMGAAIVLMLLAIALEDVIGDAAVFIAMPGAAMALWFCFAGFAGLDEVAQRAHYVAWFWGGSIGLAALPLLGLLVLPFGFWNGGVAELSQLLWGEATPETGFFTGAVIVLAPPLIGYTAWWLAFWLPRR